MTLLGGLRFRTGKTLDVENLEFEDKHYLEDNKFTPLFGFAAGADIRMVRLNNGLVPVYLTGEFGLDFPSPKRMIYYLDRWDMQTDYSTIRLGTTFSALFGGGIAYSVLAKDKLPFEIGIRLLAGFNIAMFRFKMEPDDEVVGSLDTVESSQAFIGFSGRAVAYLQFGVVHTSKYKIPIRLELHLPFGADERLSQLGFGVMIKAGYSFMDLKLVK